MRSVRVAEDLERRAEKALAAGEIERALDAYQALELTFRSEPSWSRQVASLHQQLGDPRASLAALARAAERCLARQEPIKAIAACKLMQAIDPEDPGAKEILDRLLGPRPEPARLPHLTADLELPENTGTSPAVIPLLRRQPHRAESSGALHLLHDGGNVLGQVPLFSSLDRPALAGMLAEASLFRASAGHRIFAQGDPGDRLYVIIEGSVSVYLEGSPRLHLADLEEGTFFGEIALFTDRPRGATAEVRTDVELLSISRQAVLQAIRACPTALSVLLSFLRERLADTVIKTSPVFQGFDWKARAELAGRFSLIDADEGAIVIAQGNRANGLYVLVDGSMAVTRIDQRGAQPVAVLEPGQLFGEISAITLLPPVATVRATAPALLLHLPAERIDDTVAAHPNLLAYATRLAAERLSALDASNGPAGRTMDRIPLV